MSKIKSPELQRMVTEDSGGQVGVIIEIDLPQAQVNVRQVSRGGIRMNIPLGVTPALDADEESIEKRIDEARRFLEDTLHTSPRWLRAAHSFVARVTPEQIRLIAAHPAIKAIWPNREHQAIFSAR